MQTKPIKRPWVKAHRRYNPDPFYQSPQWKQIRSSFRRGVTYVNGFPLPNIYCIDCYKETGKMIPGSNTDHIKRRKDGGADDHTNLQTQCDHHHAVKSAEEGNSLRK